MEISSPSKRSPISSVLHCKLHANRLPLLVQAIRRQQNRTIEAARVIEELVALIREMREASAHGEKPGLTEGEPAFYDALETNDNAVKVLGDETLQTIAQELVRTLRNNVTIDWMVKESVRADIRVKIRWILNKRLENQ